MSRIPERNGVEQIWAAIRVLQANEQKRRGLASFLENATVGSGGLKFVDGGSINLGDGGSIYLSEDGKFLAVGDTTYVQILDDSFSIGTIVDGTFGRPSMIMQPDGFLAAISDTEYAVFKVDAVDGAAVITSSTGVVRLPYQNTSSSANTRILFDGTIQLVTSSMRYKTDPAPAIIDVDDVRQMQGRTWVDIATAERAAEAGEEVDIPRDVGFIAEELDALPSLRQFVDYDAEGRPDAIQYDRLTVALLELLKDVDGQTTDLRALLSEQQSQINELTARLDSLTNG